MNETSWGTSFKVPIFSIFVMLLLFPSNSLADTKLLRSSAVNARSQNVRDKPNKIYGPWGTAGNLRTAFVKYFKKQIDEEKYDVNLFGNLDDALDDMISYAQWKTRMDTYRQYVERDNALFSGKSFGAPTARIAASFNRFLGKDVFSASDFIPSDEDYVKGRDIMNDPFYGPWFKVYGYDTAILGQRHQWLTIWEYIDRVYDRIAKKSLTDMERPRHN
jgi:hypothetical protein